MKELEATRQKLHHAMLKDSLFLFQPFSPFYNSQHQPKTSYHESTVPMIQLVHIMAKHI